MPLMSFTVTPTHSPFLPFHARNPRTASLSKSATTRTSLLTSNSLAMPTSLPPILAYIFTPPTSMHTFVPCTTATLPFPYWHACSTATTSRNSGPSTHPTPHPSTPPCAASSTHLGPQPERSTPPLLTYPNSHSPCHTPTPSAASSHALSYL